MTDKKLKQLMGQLKSACEPNDDWLKNSRGILLSKIIVTADEAPKDKTLFWYKLIDKFLPENFALQPAMAFSLVLGLFLIVSFASVNASKNTLPGDVLYPVKLTAESVKYNLTFSEAEKAKVAMSRVETRMNELKIIVKQENSEKQAKVARSASRIKNDLNIVKNKIQNLKQNSENSEVVAVAKEIDEKLVVLKDEINKTNQESVGVAEPALKEVALEIEKTSEVVVAALETESAENTLPLHSGQAENTTTPMVEGEATTTILWPEQDFNTTSELIIEEKVKDEGEQKEFKVGIDK